MGPALVRDGRRKQDDRRALAQPLHSSFRSVPGYVLKHFRANRQIKATKVRERAFEIGRSEFPFRDVPLFWWHPGPSMPWTVSTPKLLAAASHDPVAVPKSTTETGLSNSMTGAIIILAMSTSLDRAVKNSAS
jgi:hypothetical protein